MRCLALEVGCCKLGELEVRQIFLGFRHWEAAETWGREGGDGTMLKEQQNGANFSIQKLVLLSNRLKILVF